VRRQAQFDYRVLTLAEQHHGKDHPLVAVALTSLAGVYAVQGREAEAQAARARAQELAELPFRTYPYAPTLGAPARRAAPLVLAPATAQPVSQSAPQPVFQPEPQPAPTSQPLRAPTSPPTIRSLVFPRRR
jgi:hypothetical protein